MRTARCVLGLVFASLIFFSAAHGGEAVISGQSYDTFLRYYQDNIHFINRNDSRHLLPLVLAKRGDVQNDGRLTFELIGDTLSVTILTDPSGKIIESCQITLTAPSGMEYENAIYNDFAISGYHSYALLMAMHADPDPVRRYDLVTDVVHGMLVGNGYYSRHIGVYSLECSRSGNVARLVFQNNRVRMMPEEEAAEDEDAGFL